MPEKMNWLAEVAEKLRPGAAATLPSLLPQSPVDAWGIVERASMASEQQLVQAAAAYFSITVANLDRASTASISVLPYSLGVQLGFDWHSQTAQVSLAGTLAHVEARGIVVDDPSQDGPSPWRVGSRQGRHW